MGKPTVKQRRNSLWITLRLSRAQAEEIHRRAKAMGMDRSKWLRVTLFGMSHLPREREVANATERKHSAPKPMRRLPRTLGGGLDGVPTTR